MTQPRATREHPTHHIAGRIAGTSGIATFCTCGHAFFADYVPDGIETSQSRTAARERADLLWDVHWQHASPDMWRLVHPQDPKEPT